MKLNHILDINDETTSIDGWILAVKNSNKTKARERKKTPRVLVQNNQKRLVFVLDKTEQTRFYMPFYKKEGNFLMIKLVQSTQNESARKAVDGKFQSTVYLSYSSLNIEGDVMWASVPNVKDLGYEFMIQVQS